MNFQSILSEIDSEVARIPDEGKVASYIPELAKVDAGKFGMHLWHVDGDHCGIGDDREAFSVQSIAKVFSLTLAYELEGESIWKRVGVEPSGTRFNSLMQLEFEQGIPRNPLINSGALVIADILYGRLKDPRRELLDFIRLVSGLPDVGYNETVALSEKQSGFRNAALVNLMRSFGNIRNDIEGILDFYFHLCSIEMTCAELSKAFLLYANHGKIPGREEEIISKSKAKRINAIMQTCGFYDEAGEFAFKVGLPGKSGVGGGIAAVHPGKYAVAVWSPGLNKKGNSFKGMKALELLTTKTELSIF